MTHAKYGVPDAENPEWTKEMFARSKRIDELPPSLRDKLRAIQRSRGPQKAPTKKSVTVRLSVDVLQALRATGRGWQSKVDETLREQFVKRA